VHSTNSGCDHTIGVLQAAGVVIGARYTRRSTQASMLEPLTKPSISALLLSSLSLRHCHYHLPLHLLRWMVRLWRWQTHFVHSSINRLSRRNFGISSGRDLQQEKIAPNTAFHNNHLRWTPQDINARRRVRRRLAQEPSRFTKDVGIHHPLIS
jgi:hypothetical protein